MNWNEGRGGARLATGLYLLRLEATSGALQRKLVLAR